MLSEKNKKLLAALFMLLLASVSCIILVSSAKGCGCNSGNPQPEPSDKVFEDTAQNFIKLKSDLKQMVDKTIGSDSSSIISKSMSMDPQKILSCVKSKMKANGMRSYSFNMSGDKLDAPIIAMHETNPKIFSILSECDFLSLVGRVIAIAAWATNSSDKSKENLIIFLSCIDRINWGSIDTWNDLSNGENSPVMKCMK